MGFRTGIVGLPNVGKSTLFNALTRSASAQAANYPFCTIEPNSGDAVVPDPRLERLAAIAGSATIIPAKTSFVDIAGLVGGAARGEGLGNRFLASIREMDAIAHILRCFEDDGVTHVEGVIDPVSDAHTVETELMLSDLDSIDRQQARLLRKVRGGEPDAVARDASLRCARAALEDGRPASDAMQQDHMIATLGLITAKPVLYVCNVDEGSVDGGNLQTRAAMDFARERGAKCILMSASLEAQTACLDATEAKDYLAEFGCHASGLEQLVRAGYDMLGLLSFFTVGVKEARAWTVPKGTRALAAAGVIHGDFERGFIRAETVSYEDFIACGGEAGARANGKLRSEGRDYILEDGDVLRVLFNI